MKTLLSAVFAVSLMFAAPQAAVAMAGTPAFDEEVAEHGGGCRKSSPPGMCCHMDHKTGIVHCH